MLFLSNNKNVSRKKYDRCRNYNIMGQRKHRFIKKQYLREFWRDDVSRVSDIRASFKIQRIRETRSRTKESTNNCRNPSQARRTALSRQSIKWTLSQGNYSNVEKKRSRIYSINLEDLWMLCYLPLFLCLYLCLSLSLSLIISIFSRLSLFSSS